MSGVPRFSVDVLRDIEMELSKPLFRGVPIGPTLNDLGCTELHVGHGDWSCKTRWRNRISLIKHALRPQMSMEDLPRLPEGRILVTLLSMNYRLRDLVFPVLHELGPDRCIILCASADMVSQVPRGLSAIYWNQFKQFDVSAWRAEWRRCWPEWRERIRALCRRHHLPRGAFERIAVQMQGATQRIAGCLKWLPLLRPSAILTEHDRQSAWSCLVLSARTLGIPVITQVHGVLNEQAVGYVPVLADKVLCWGGMQREQFLMAGENPQKLVVTGCPRLTRDLSVSQADARRKLGLEHDKPVVMLGTSMVDEQNRRHMAEVFCAAINEVPDVSAYVRLHPADQLDTYDSVAKRYPDICFASNEDATLDEALAAADVVVVPNSGLGSDALVKRRLVIVLALSTSRIGHARDLMERASCLCAGSAEELATQIRELVYDYDKRQRYYAEADKYVTSFCEFFGADAARNIAYEVLELATSSVS